jgi:hypothetical protein
VIVNGDGEDLFGVLLPDNVFIEFRFDLHGLGHGHPARDKAFLRLFGDDLVAELNTLITDIDRRTGNQLADLILAFSAKGAP